MGSIIDVLVKYWPIFLKGLLGTLKYAAIAVSIGTVIGTFVAVLALSKHRLPRDIATVYSTIIRGTPLLVQMNIAYFFLPMAFPALNVLTKEHCVILSLCINSGAYVSEIIRGGIQSVDRGQTEAARSLGMSPAHTMFRIVLPQSLKAILPSLGNEYVSMVKETSMAGTFMLYELMYTKVILAGKYLIWEPMFIIAAIYLVVTMVLTGLIRLMERRFSASDRND